VSETLLIIAASEQDANLYYATRFWAPDSFIFVQINGKKFLIMNDLELDRAKSEAKVDQVLSLSTLVAQAKRSGVSTPGMIDALEVFLKEQSVKLLKVPPGFPVVLADKLRAKGYELVVGREPFLPQRMIKTPEEVNAIRETIRLTEEALKSVIALIQGSEIKQNGELWLKGRPLTSELIRKYMHLTLMGSDCLGRETIIAGGNQACDPHCVGFGPLKAHMPIVLDVFPVSMKSRYYADITRTVLRGTASPQVKKMYAAVQHGQEIGFGMMKHGADGQKIHQAIVDYFEKEGFRTGLKNGRMTGFFHGTGHGLGLEIHEAPRISSVSDILQAGQVVTVEPGLYYPDVGGIRIEDDVLVTESGCEVLSTFPRLLELN